MDDPLKKIEDQRGQMDMGVLGQRVYKGAIEEGATMMEAFLVTCALYVGAFHPKPPLDEVEGGE